MKEITEMKYKTLDFERKQENEREQKEAEMERKKAFEVS